MHATLSMRWRSYVGVYTVPMQDQHIFLNLKVVHAYVRNQKTDMPGRMKSTASLYTPREGKKQTSKNF